MPDLLTKYMGIDLKNPVVIASSGFTNSIEKIKELESAGAGAIVLKSIFEEQINHEVNNLLNRNPQDQYPEIEDIIWNYSRNNSITRYLNLLSEAKKETEIPIIASINCMSASEWVAFSKEFENSGADALELNLYFIPVNSAKSSLEIEDFYLDVISKVCAIVRIPVSVKIGYYFTNLISMAQRLSSAGASALVLFNRFYEPDINLENLEMSSSEIFSSPSDIRQSLRWIGIISSQLPTLELAAGTGIHNGDALIKQLLAGAQVAQLGSSVYINGPQVITEILRELSAFMQKWNFETVADFRGRLSYSNIPDPSFYERAQFMKYFTAQ